MKGAGRTVIAIAVATLVVAALSQDWTAAALVMRAAGTPGWAGTLARWDTRVVSETLERVPLQSGAIRARILRPSGPPARAALLVSGVHPDGIDDPRLINLARELAAAGVVVVTPEIGDLIRYRVTSRVTDTIEESALWMLQRPDLFGAADVGLVGVSFSGGLAVVAAGRPRLRDRVAYVLSFGGHGNLPRVLNYLCTGLEPGTIGVPGHARPPHDYALAVVLHQAADFAVPAEQVAPLRQGIETFLQASTLSRTSPTEAARLFEDARARETELPEPARTLMRHVNHRSVAALGRLLMPYLDRLGQDAALSPERSNPPTAPVYLLHGAEDNVIPAVESTLLAQHLRGQTRVRQLMSGYLTHVDLSARPTARDTWDMIAFWTSLLNEYVRRPP